jgi:putative ABC transport system substrate-binding protein
MTETGAAHYRAFFGELRRLGYVEGENLVVDRYFGGGRIGQYRELVGEVIRGQPDAVLAVSSNLVLEFKAQTSTLPVVGSVSDPVALGIARSLARPGENITGVATDAGLEVWGKRLGLLKEPIPSLSRVGLLVAPTPLGRRGAEAVRKISKEKGLAIIEVPLESPLNEMGYRRAFAAFVREGAEAVYVGDEGEHSPHYRLIIDLAQQHRLPASYPFSGFVRAGGLMAYAADLPDLFVHAAKQLDQILKGTKPGEVPFYQATKFDLAINLKTAKALGIEIQTSLLAQADEVIE